MFGGLSAAWAAPIDPNASPNAMAIGANLLMFIFRLLDWLALLRYAVRAASGSDGCGPQAESALLSARR
jgi:hypothetical protein